MKAHFNKQEGNYFCGCLDTGVLLKLNICHKDLRGLSESQFKKPNKTHERHCLLY